jgi:hypothetical protein
MKGLSPPQTTNGFQMTFAASTLKTMTYLPPTRKNPFLIKKRVKVASLSRTLPLQNEYKGILSY